MEHADRNCLPTSARKCTKVGNAVLALWHGAPVLIAHSSVDHPEAAADGGGPFTRHCWPARHPRRRCIRGRAQAGTAPVRRRDGAGTGAPLLHTEERRTLHVRDRRRRPSSLGAWGRRGGQTGGAEQAQGLGDFLEREYLDRSHAARPVPSAPRPPSVSQAFVSQDGTASRGIERARSLSPSSPTGGCSMPWSSCRRVPPSSSSRIRQP